MLYFTRWKALAIIVTALVVCLCAVPNFFPETTVKTWPAWAQRRLVLGLDLQGGSYLLLEVDANSVRKDRPARPRGVGGRPQRDPHHRVPAGDARPHAQDHRAVDPDRRAPRQRARHGRAHHPAPAHRPQPGAGAEPAAR